MVVYTGGSASVFYDYETTFGTAVATDKPFGLNQKVTSLSVQTNRLNFNKLGQVETTAFAFGQQAGSLGIGFVFDDNVSHNIFESIYGEDTSNPHVYPATLGQGQAMTTMTGRSLTTEIAVQMGNAHKLRKLTGCVVNSIGLSTSIGQPVNGTIDMSFGKEVSSTIDGSGAITQQTAQTQAGNPYTFAHGHFKVHNGSALTEIGEIQDCDINWTTNSELLYGIGSHYAQSSFKRALDISGKFKASFKDSIIATHVLDQAKDSSNTTMLGGAADAVGIELVFENNDTAADSLKIELSGVAIGDYSVSGIEPVEPVFEDVAWKAKSARITATQP
jgi:hypothetical protein|tara:strand:+ start:171 stop:1166 length:996 start_codon:yes stop_codon:yes gene_type:complete